MLTKTHKKLSYIFLNKNNITIFDKLFIFGCISPDINIFTYIKGSIKYKKKLSGHNNENTKKYILKNLKSLSNSKRIILINYFQLGRTIHYIADSFTYTHTNKFNGNINEHLEYEKNLNEYINNNNIDISNEKIIKKENIIDYFLNMQNEYFKRDKSIKNDYSFIFKTCYVITNTLLKNKYYKDY